MNRFDDTVKRSLSFLDNEYVNASVYLFLILYAGLAAPKLPEYVAKLFDYTLVKVLLFFLIVYISKKNPTLAIIASIAVIVSIMTLNRFKFGNELMSMISNENVPQGEICPSNCENCNCKHNKVYNTMTEDIANTPYDMYGSQHEVENMLRRGYDSEEALMMPKMSTLHEQSVNGVVGDLQETVRSENSSETPKVSIEHLAEEVRSRLNGPASAEEIKAVCAQVTEEYRNNVNRFYTRQEYNDSEMMGHDAGAKMYASA